uniref:Large ribosomal subunit protein uL2 RNA-binding domain-containing protein n=1 Tax=Lactuca sativa TaxID=4236 RepID=A0A9R1X8G0_LACSA|nr:hypothetical protein LSAT_V11C600308840 [Lactuca sativa]
MWKTHAQNVSSERPLRQFVTGKDKSAGRNSKGRITIFHRGGGGGGNVERIEYDPNCTSRIAVVRWVEGAVVDLPKKFSFSSIPGMLEDKKVESLRPKTDHVVVGLSKGSRTLSSQSQS